MTPAKLLELLPRCFKSGRQVLICAAPGVGKTAIVQQAAQASGHDLIITHPAISDPTDYKGLPAKADLKDGEIPYATFLPFGELHRAIECKKPTVFFIDDIGASPDSVQKALMQLLWGRRLNGHKLPDHLTFCGATNDVGQRAGVSGILEPVKSRWHSIIHMQTTIDDWSQWGTVNGMAPELIAFLRTRPELLHKFEPTRDLVNSPCPRTWSMVGDWLAIGIREFEVLSGAVGKGPATEFCAFLEMASEAPSIDAILMNPESELVPEKPALRYLVSAGLAHRATKQNIDRVAKYLARLPQPFRVLAYRDAVRKDRSLATTPSFIVWASAEGRELL